MISQLIVGIGWLVLIGYWIVSAFGVKKTARGRKWWVGSLARLAFFLVALFFLRHSHLAHGRPGHAPSVFASPAIRALGVMLCVAGIAFAIWARRYLGRNWGMPMSLREGHELITTGPYAYVRHPIYSGILLAQLGSFLAGREWWLALFVACAIYFIYSAVTEEKLMAHEFPTEFQNYKQRTKMLVPFVF
jgi:protein-S-isoprenylcysteine O-methyltransferase Ste14